MISSFFGKTKPINYIVLLSFVFLFYWFAHFFIFGRAYGPEEAFLQLCALVTLSFSFFVIDFIIKRNKVTAPNSFSLLFFALLIVVFPETLIDSNAIYCSFFLLLALRRLVSLRSLKNMRPKIFDASIWILVASLFYDWALLYLLLVFMAVYMYEPKVLKNWLVPFAGAFTVFMISYAVLVLAGNTEFLWQHYRFDYAFNKNYFLHWGNGTKLILYIIGVSVIGLLSFLKLGKAGMGKVATMRLIAMTFVVGIVLKILVSSEDVYPIIITFFSAAVFFTKYVESIRRPNIKEIVLMVSIFVPFMVLFVGLIID